MAAYSFLEGYGRWLTDTRSWLRFLVELSQFYQGTRFSSNDLESNLGEGCRTTSQVFLSFRLLLARRVKCKELETTLIRPRSASKHAHGSWQYGWYLWFINVRSLHLQSRRHFALERCTRAFLSNSSLRDFNSPKRSTLAL